jgi:hypothetical protein
MMPEHLQSRLFSRVKGNRFRRDISFAYRRLHNLCDLMIMSRILSYLFDLYDILGFQIFFSVNSAELINTGSQWEMLV